MNDYLNKIASYWRREVVARRPRNQPKKILFDHLPKCGGLTLNAYLESHYPRRKVFSTNPKKASSPEYRVDYDELIRAFKNLPEQSRHRYNLVTGHFSNELIDFVHPECIKITVLRDPVERIISHYFYVKSSPEHYLHSKVKDDSMSLEDYATSNLSDELQNWYTAHFSGLSREEVEEMPEESVVKAANFVFYNYNLVGFLDDFPSFMLRLKEVANFQYEYNDSDRTNVTRNKPSSRDIPQSVIETIKQVNSLDVDFYQRVKEQMG